MDKNAKIYVAGHKGLVGSAIKRCLEAQGYANIIGRTSAELDLTDRAATEAFFETEKPDYVFLAAAKVGGINANNLYRADFIYNNLAIQNNVVKASYDHSVKKLLFLGSVCIYPKFAELPITEESLLTGELEYTNEPYALAKIAGIKLVESYNLQYGTNYLAVMPANLYGTNDNFDLEKSHVIPALIRKTLLCKYLQDEEYQKVADNLGLKNTSEDDVFEAVGKYGIKQKDGKVVMSVWGTGKPYREFMHSDDMGEACVFVMNHINFADLSAGLSEVRNTHINLGTGSDITIKDLVIMIKDIVGFNGDVEFDTSKPDGTYRRTMSVDKIHKLGWQHKLELRDGLQETIKWYKENHGKA